MLVVSVGTIKPELLSWTTATRRTLSRMCGLSDCAMHRTLDRTRSHSRMCCAWPKHPLHARWSPHRRQIEISLPLTIRWQTPQQISVGRWSLSITAMQNAVPVKRPLELTKGSKLLLSWTVASPTPRILRAMFLLSLPPFARAFIAHACRSVGIGHRGIPLFWASARC